MMNEIIKNGLRKDIDLARIYLQNTSLRASVEHCWSDLQESISSMVEENEPDMEWAIDLNRNALKVLTLKYTEALEDEKAPELVLANVLSDFDKLDEDAIVRDFIIQLSKKLPELELKDEYTSVYAMLFEYDYGPKIHLSSYPPQKLDILMDRSRYLEFEVGDYATKNFLELDFSKVASPIFSKEYDALTWTFDPDLLIFEKFKELYIEFTFYCLHIALKSEEIETILNELPIDGEAVFYGGEHDMPYRTIYVR